jgi:hypothetical protein
MWGLPLPILTVFITIGTFTLGIIIAQLINAWSRYVTRKTFRVILALSHKELIEEINKQVGFLKNDIKNMVIEHEGHYVLQFKTTHTLSVFKEIGYENMYKAFLGGWITPDRRDANTKALTKFWSNIASADVMYVSSTELFEHNMSEFVKFDAARYVTLQKAQDLIEAYNLRITGKVKQNELKGILLVRRDKITKDWVTQKNYAAPYLADKYANAMLDVNRDMMSKLQEHEDEIKFVEINSYLNQTKGHFLNMNVMLNMTVEQLSHIAKQFDKVQISLKEVEHLLHQPFVPVWLMKNKWCIILFTVAVILCIGIIYMFLHTK